MKDKDIGLRLEKEADERGIPLAPALRKRLREDPNEPIAGTVAQAESQTLEEGTSIKARAASWQESDSLVQVHGLSDGDVASMPDKFLREHIKPMHPGEETEPEPLPVLPKTTPDQRLEELTKELVAFYRQYGVMPRSVLQEIQGEFRLHGKIVSLFDLEEQFNRMIAPAEYARQVAAIYLRNAEKG